MLALENRQINSVFERIIKDKNGTLIRVRFTIVEKDGSFQGQIISATPFISKVDSSVFSSSSTSSFSNTSKSEKRICLPCVKNNEIVIENVIPSLISIFSPYFSLDFFMSQPTRAPAFAI